MKKIGILIGAWGIVFALFFNACKKEDEKSITDDELVSIAFNDVAATDAFNDIYSEAEDVITTSELTNFAGISKTKSSTVQGSRSVSIAIGEDTTVTIVYTGFIGKNGRKKDGTIIIKQSGKMWEKNSTRTLTLQNFIINDTLLIEGTETIKNLGLLNFKLTLNLNIEDAKVSNLITGNWVSFDNDYTLTWDRSLNLLNIWDDTFIIKGQGKGSNQSGFNYSFAITDTNPLFMRSGCPCIVQGEAILTVEDQKSITIDFGEGYCDGKFKLKTETSEQEMASIKGNEVTN